jgi:hypothetical protein
MVVGFCHGDQSYQLRVAAIRYGRQVSTAREELHGMGAGALVEKVDLAPFLCCGVQTGGHAIHFQKETKTKAFLRLGKSQGRASAM